jgi:hypothetical protein
MINASTIFSPAQCKDMEELVRVNEELKVLESKKKTLSDKVKKHMTSLNVDECDVNGTPFKIIESVRKTVTKNTKDEFIAALVGQNKQYLLVTSIEPDVDSIFAEVDAGTLSKDFVDTYIKVTPVKTLRTN